MFKKQKIIIRNILELEKEIKQLKKVVQRYKRIIELRDKDIELLINTEDAIRQIISKKYKEGGDYKVKNRRGQYLTNDDVVTEIIKYFRFKFLNK